MRVPNVFYFILFSLISTIALATEPRTDAPVKPPAKAERRTKKIKICPTCGRPEPKCECEEEERKQGERPKETK